MQTTNDGLQTTWTAFLCNSISITSYSIDFFFLFTDELNRIFAWRNVPAIARDALPFFFSVKCLTIIGDMNNRWTFQWTRCCSSALRQREVEKSLGEDFLVRRSIQFLHRRAEVGQMCRLNKYSSRSKLDDSLSNICFDRVSIRSRKKKTDILSSDDDTPFLYMLSRIMSNGSCSILFLRSRSRSACSLLVLRCVSWAFDRTSC